MLHLILANGDAREVRDPADGMGINGQGEAPRLGKLRT
jgi:hypothetical protein